jgi:hypothetical protein
MSDRKINISNSTNSGFLVLMAAILLFTGEPDLYDAIMCKLLPDKCEIILVQYDEYHWYGQQENE